MDENASNADTAIQMPLAAGSGLDGLEFSSASDMHALPLFLAAKLESPESHAELRPQVLAWIRALSPVNAKKPGDREPSSSSIRSIKAARVEDLLMAPFLSLRLDPDEKGAIFKELCQAHGHACAPIKSYGSKLSTIQAASMGASQIDDDAGIWIQCALGQGLDPKLLGPLTAEHRQGPSSDSMLPPTDCQGHPQFRLALLALRFGWALHLNEQRLFSDALNLNIERWRRFNRSQSQTTIPNWSKGLNWDQGFSAVCDAAMPQGATLDPQKHAWLLEHCARGGLPDTMELFTSRGWLPIQAWAMDTPFWLQKQIELISETEAHAWGKTLGDRSDALHGIALAVMVERERQALSQTVSKKNPASSARSL